MNEFIGIVEKEKLPSIYGNLVLSNQNHKTGGQGNMGDDLQDIGLDCQFKVHLKDSSPGTLPAAFGRLSPQFLTDLLQKVLAGFGEHVMAFKEKPSACRSCGNNREFSWKTRHGKKTKIQALAAGGLQTLRGKQYLTRQPPGMDMMKSFLIVRSSLMQKMRSSSLACSAGQCRSAFETAILPNFLLYIGR